VIGIGASVLVAGGLGLALGAHNRKTAEEIMAEHVQAARPTGQDISREVNRTLLELWRMEDAEAGRDRP
jgi:hypothetical protein